MRQKDKTLIQVSKVTWQELNKEKLMSNETFDTVIKRILKFYRQNVTKEENQW